jgi:hypothetical protein
MWECIASRANLELPARGNAPRVRVLPGGGALAELAAALWDGKVPGVTANSAGERVRLLFSDSVHMATLAAASSRCCTSQFIRPHPRRRRIPRHSPRRQAGIQTLAWQYAVSYGQQTNAAARQDMATCRTLMQKDLPSLCGLESRPAGSWRTQAKFNDLSLSARVRRRK